MLFGRDLDRQATTCLYWRWTCAAGCFALGWCALRRDLVFPSDALWSEAFGLLRTEEPTTRSWAARRQSTKLEPADLIAVTRLAFEHLRPALASLRQRLYSALATPGVDRGTGREKPLDLGSLRAGEQLCCSRHLKILSFFGTGADGCHIRL